MIKNMEPWNFNSILKNLKIPLKIAVHTGKFNTLRVTKMHPPAMLPVQYTLMALLALFILISVPTKAQTPSPDPLAIVKIATDSSAGSAEPTLGQVNPLTIYGFVDAYYSYDFGQPQNHERPGFLFNYKPTNEFNVNLALVRLLFAGEKVRGNVGLMAGTYAEYNLAKEQSLLKNIYEANAGFKLARKVWLDAGIFPSHIGAETVISRDNLNLTRSLGAENTPYYEAGAKITYEATSKLTVTGLMLNGWQNIRENNNDKAFGAQIQYKLTDKILLNYSNFIGNEKPDSASQTRFFHDFYATATLCGKWRLVGGFDFGTEEKPPGESGNNNWWNPTLCLKYHLTDKFGIAARGEYYHDKNVVIIGTGTENGFQTFGYSLNLDYAPAEQVLWRVEGRMFNSKDDIFTDRFGDATDKNTAVTTSLSFKF
jgi:hypothetical protein